MGFLKKSSAPSELPDLAINSLGHSSTQPVVKPAISESPSVQEVSPQSVPVIKEKKPVAGEDYLEFSHNEVPSKPAHDDIKKAIDDNLLKASETGMLSKAGFFDKVLDDINGELKDVGQIGDWYEKKFMKENVVSNMKGYWEHNKADIIIESFGAEYKRQINEKIRGLQNLEEDWREIYFKLVKKEEEMNKEERELKETLSEFVNLCKKREDNGEEKTSNKE